MIRKPDKITPKIEKSVTFPDEKDTFFHGICTFLGKTYTFLSKKGTFPNEKGT